MNPKLSFLFSRRSVRRFTAEDVPAPLVNDLLEAAMAAPSAVARDPWHFIVIRKRETLLHLTTIMPHAQMLKEAPVGIVVCGDLTKAHDQQESYLLQDCAAAIENLLIAAATLGLGGCWLGIHPRQERIEGIRKHFALPDSIIPVSGIALGWPAEPPAPRTRFNASAVHQEVW